MKESEEATLQSPPYSTGVGARLAAAREKWGLSVEETAQCLNLSGDIIRALEQDAYERLPGATFVMGYLRAYAKLLKLDHEEIIAGVCLEAEQDREIPYAREPLKRPRRARPNKRGGLLLGALLIVGVLVGLIAATQLPGPGVNKLLEAIGLSPQAGLEEKSFEMPFSNRAADDPQDSALKIE